jgi:hypothetical protein
MRWTLRLKRHGGLRALEAKRVAQFARLARLSMVPHKGRLAKEAQENIKACFDWLNVHPLRVMSLNDESAMLDHLEPKNAVVPSPD